MMVHVLLSETVSRLEAQFQLLFLANIRHCFKWGNRVAITDRSQAMKGLCLVSSMIILLQLTSVNVCLFIVSSALTWNELWDHFYRFNALSTVFLVYKGDISWNCTSNAIC